MSAALSADRFEDGKINIRSGPGWHGPAIEVRFVGYRAMTRHHGVAVIPDEDGAYSFRYFVNWKNVGKPNDVHLAILDWFNL